MNRRAFLIIGFIAAAGVAALLPSAAWATTNNTITIDASLADWHDNEKLGTSFGQFYFTQYPDDNGWPDV